MKIRTHLVILGLAMLAPMIAFAILAVVALDRQQRTVVERGAVETARALSHAVDRELSGMLATLHTLGTARSLERDDLAAFYADARRVLASRPEWSTIILIAPTGQLLMDTFFPFGTPLPRIVERDSFETVLRTGQPVVGPIRFGPMSQQFASAIRVPIRRNGRIVYVLTGVLEIRALERLLSAQRIPEDWVGTVFDSNRTVVARTRGAEQFVGRTVSPEFAKVLDTATEGWTVTHTLEGTPVYTAFSRSPVTGWGVGLGIPLPAVDAPLRRSLWTIAGAGIALLVLGTGLALLIGRRLARGLGDVAAAVGAIGRREPVRVPPTGVAEVDQVATGLVAASARRDEAERALQEHEARLATTLTSIGDGVIATDIHGRVTFVNPAAAALTGWPEAEAVGQEITAVFRIVNENTGQQTENPVARVLAEGTVVGLANDTVLLARDGREIPIEDSAAPIRVGGEVTNGVVLVFHDASARRQALAEFRVLANAAPVLVWMAGMDGGCTFFNQPWLDFTGRPLAAELGDGWAAGVHPQDLVRCLDTYRSAFADRRPFEMEYRLRRHDGAYRWILNRGMPRYGPDGRFSGYIGSCIDITERRQGEEVQRYLAAIVEGSDDAIVSKTLDGVITSWNPGATRMFGYSADEAIGRPITLIIPPDRVGEEEHVLALIRRGEGLEHLETVRARKDGTRVEVSLTVSPIRESDGRIVGASKIVRDITRAKQLERERTDALKLERKARLEAEALARVNRELTQSLDLHTVGQRIVDQLCQVLGGAVAVLYAMDPESGDLVAMARAGPFAPRLADDYRLGRNAGLVGLAVRERQSVVTDDLLNDPRLLWSPTDERDQIARTGHRAACAIPLILQEEVIGALGIGYESGRRFEGDAKTLAERFGDLAALALQNARSFAREQALRTESEAANRAKDEFLGMLGHELRNPLAAIVNAARLLQVVDTPEERAQVQEIIGRQTAHMTKLMDDLLEVSRITAGRIALRPEPVDLRAEVERYLGLLHTEERAAHLTIRLTGGAPTWVDADVTRLEQIIANLLDNAIKFTPAGGEIQVTVGFEAPQTAVFRVRDTGIGIPATVLPRIFDPFTQAAQSLDRAQGGLGLGLTIVRRLVELHRGTVEVHSGGSGKGAEFIVRLPEREAPSVIPESNNETPPLIVPRRILIIEDNADARETMRLLLTRDGHVVDLAEDGPTGLDKLRTDPPEIALIDVGLPGLDGYQVVRAAVQGTREARPYLVAVTGYGQSRDVERAREAGFDAHLVKPLQYAQLQRLIADVPITPDEDRPAVRARI
jgi:PAS domain S-box-containing protein